MHTDRINQLAEDLYHQTFEMLDAEPEIDFEEAGRVASMVQRWFTVALTYDLDAPPEACITPEDRLCLDTLMQDTNSPYGPFRGCEIHDLKDDGSGKVVGRTGPATCYVLFHFDSIADLKLKLRSPYYRQ